MFLKKEGFVKLSRPATFMHVDDDVYVLAGQLEYLNLGLVPYKKSGYRADLGHFSGARYYKAKDALSDLQNTEVWPEIILLDIELGSNTNGIHLAREIAEQFHYGQKSPDEPFPKIFIYSSAIGKYESELNDLKTQKVIADYFPKQIFSFEDFIHRVDHHLSAP